MNFIGTHHLDLIQKTAIVTHISSDLSVATARYLLNSNSNVLGLEGPSFGDKNGEEKEKKVHTSTRIGGGSNFQFMYLDSKDEEENERRGSGGFLPLTPETSRESQRSGDRTNGTKDCGQAIMERIKDRMRVQYKREDIEFLVLVRSGTEQPWEKDVKTDVAKYMRGCYGDGRIVFVSAFPPKSKEEEAVIAEARALRKELEAKGSKVGINVVVGHEICSKSSNKIEFDPEVEQALQDHISAHETARIKGGYKVEKEREIANVVLFLCTQLGGRVSGAVVGVDGFSVGL
ncbi:hypothetical protein B0J14DRAFT_694915 [Halenospora varia]|nr:hypothetical protein B0J14DRAFT_694915 [Halenospora varia]